MKQAVDNQEAQEFPEIPVEFLRFFFYHIGAKQEFALGLGQGEREHIGRNVFVSICFIKPPHFLRAHIGEGEGIFFPENFVFDIEDGQGGNLAFCLVYHGEFVFHLIYLIFPNLRSFSISRLRSRCLSVLFFTFSFDSFL